jgi:transcriptional regulator with XRE-family HTH domain
MRKEEEESERAAIAVFHDPDMRLFGTRLKKAREAAGLSQTALAWRCDFNLPTLDRLECGSAKGLRAVTLARLAQALQASTDYFPGLTDDPTPAQQRSRRRIKHHVVTPGGGDA